MFFQPNIAKQFNYEERCEATACEDAEEKSAPYAIDTSVAEVDHLCVARLLEKKKP